MHDERMNALAPARSEYTQTPELPIPPSLERVMIHRRDPNRTELYRNTHEQAGRVHPGASEGSADHPATTIPARRVIQAAAGARLLAGRMGGAAVSSALSPRELTVLQGAAAGAAAAASAAPMDC